MRSIFCLETEWNLTANKMRDRYSIVPLLNFLERSSTIYSRKVSEYIHRRVATEEDFNYYLDQANYIRYKAYDIIYLAFHGEKETIILANGTRVTLDELSQRCRKIFQDKVVHFGSCKTFCTSEKNIEEFKKITGAKIVSGYTKTVDFNNSSILDLAYFSDIIKTKYISTIEKRMERRFSGLIKELGFRII